MYPQYPYVDRLGIAYQLSSVVPQEGALGLTTSSTNTVGVLVYRHTILEEAHAASGGNQAFTDTPTGAVITLNALPNAANYQAVQWGYVVYCTPAALEYPCAVNVVGTAIISGTAPILSTCGTSKYGPLCNQPAYLMLGFTGTRTFTNRYGETLTSNMSAVVLNEDYADNLLYTVQPYVDSDGPTWRLNGTDGALTEVPGGLSVNEINLFLNPNPTEGIAVNGADSSALIYNASLTVICSTMPDFTAAAYNASTQYSAGSTNMSACLPSRTILGATVSRSTLAQTVSGARYTVAYSISDGVTFTVQAVVTVTSDGQSYNDVLGNRYLLAVQANGTRTYYDWTSASSTPITAAITGVATNVTTTTFLFAGNKNDNRIYPFSRPYLDALGFAYTVSPAAPVTGNVSLLTSTIGVVSYKDATLEEVAAGARYPTAAYQTIAIAAGTTAPTLPTPTRPSSSSPSTSTGSANTQSSAGAGRVSVSSALATSTPAAAAATSTAGVGAPPVTSGGGGGGSGLSGGDIAGIVIGSVVGALLLCGCLIFACVMAGRRDKKGAAGTGRESESNQNISTVPKESSQMGGARVVEMIPPNGNGVRISEPVEV